MDFYSPDHVWKVVPPVLGIKEMPVKEQVLFGLKVVQMPERDEDQAMQNKAMNDHTPDKATELIDAVTLARVKSKVVSIENLKIGGKSVTDFDTFYATAPPELVKWVVTAVYSTFHLTRAEIKN